MFMLTALAYLFDGLVLGFFSYRVFLSLRSKKNPFLTFFIGVSTFLSLNFVFYSILISIAIWSKDANYLFWADYSGRLMVYFGSLFAVQIPLYEVSKNVFYRTIGVSFVAILGTLLAVFNLIYRNAPYVDQLGIVHWQSPLWLGVGLAIIILGIWVPTSFIFLVEFAKSGYKLRRSLFLGLGFLLGAVGCAMQDFGTTASSYILINLVTVFGFIMIFLGVLMRAKEHATTNAK